MRHAAFTSIEGFWLLRNLLLSSAKTGKSSAPNQERGPQAFVTT